jgi:Transposase, Mutator family
VLPDSGEVDVEVPRDRDGSFEPVIVAKRQRRLRVERYRFRGSQISTPYNIDEVDPNGARFCRTSHDDAAFVGQVSEHLT